MVCHPISIQPVRGQGLPSALLRVRGRAGCRLHPQDECMQLGLACRSGRLWVWGKVLTSGRASTWGSSAWQTSIQCSSWQEGNGHQRKRSIW